MPDPTLPTPEAYGIRFANTGEWSQILTPERFFEDYAGPDDVTPTAEGWYSATTVAGLLAARPDARTVLAPVDDLCRRIEVLLAEIDAEQGEAPALPDHQRGASVRRVTQAREAVTHLAAEFVGFLRGAGLAGRQS